MLITVRPWSLHPYSATPDQMMNLQLRETRQYQPLMRAFANGCAIKWYLCYLLDMHYLDCWNF